MKVVWLAPVLAIGVSGCVAVGPLAGPADAPPADFNAFDPFAPPPIATEELAPPDGQPGPPEIMGPFLEPLAEPAEIGQPNQLAVLAVNAGVEISFDDLLGAWALSIDSGTCQLFLSGTPWEEGFRGSTRDCQSDVLASLSAWRLDGQEIVVFADGAVAARFFPVNVVRDGGLVVNARFEGQMISGGTPVVFFR